MRFLNRAVLAGERLAVSVLRAAPVTLVAFGIIAVASLRTSAVPAASTPAGKAEPLVTAEWVSQNLRNPKVRLVEVSVDPGVYEKGHIPGAVNIKWHSELVDPVRRDVITAEQFAQLAARNGIANDTTVVLYGDNNNWFAAWGAWVFSLYGHQDVRLLDGGRKKWELDKRPVATNPQTPAAAQYAVANPNPRLRARLADVLGVVEGKQDAAILDIRSPDEFSGKIFAPPGVPELAVRAGHVPGAKNVPWAKAVNQEDGTFKKPDELRALYASAGVDGGKPAIVYCRIGERSAHTWFALSKLLGYDVRQYDGSWTEYGNAVGVPIDNPAGTVWTGK